MTSLGIYGVTYRFSHQLVLDEVSFELSGGQVLALIGPNGSGKSTLLKAVAGVIPLRSARSSGLVRIDGSDFVSATADWRARHIAYVGSELRSEFPLTAEEAVALGRICHGQRGDSEHLETVRAAMEVTFCWGLRDREIGTLSGGERQLVSIARAIAQGARILFLDEALSRMDLHHQIKIGMLIRELASRGLAVLIVSHDLNAALEWADLCLLLSRGKRIAYGKISDVLTEKNLKILYPEAMLRVGQNPETQAPQVFVRKTM